MHRRRFGVRPPHGLLVVPRRRRHRLGDMIDLRHNTPAAGAQRAGPEAPCGTIAMVAVARRRGRCGANAEEVHHGGCHRISHVIRRWLAPSIDHALQRNRTHRRATQLHIGDCTARPVADLQAPIERADQSAGPASHPTAQKDQLSLMHGQRNVVEGAHRDGRQSVSRAHVSGALAQLQHDAARRVCLFVCGCVCVCDVAIRCVCHAEHNDTRAGAARYRNTATRITATT